jgi:hypothetical protein
MKLSYTVTRARDTTGKVVQVTNAKGQKIDAKVDSFEVELVGTEREFGTFSLHFDGDGIAEAKAKFIPGHVITWSL